MYISLHVDPDQIMPPSSFGVGSKIQFLQTYRLYNIFVNIKFDSCQQLDLDSDHRQYEQIQMNMDQIARKGPLYIQVVP